MKLPSRFIIVLVALIGCGEEPIDEGPSAGERHLNDILEFMEANSINRSTINWTEFREKVSQKAPNAKTIAQTYQAIELAIKLLNDHHSYYKIHNTTFYDAEVCPWWDDPPDMVAPPGIGYVRIRGFQGTQAEGYEFAEILQAIIKKQDKSDLKGWIVDLRGYTSGNMYPMLAGVGPILNDSVAGHFVFPQGRIYSYGYKNGKIYAGGYSQWKVNVPYTLINPKSKVAVLIDGANSAGEGIANTFAGRPNTRLFGARGTCGRTTGIIGLTLSDGALLGVAHCWMADRNKNVFKVAIPPDQISKDDATAVQDAIDWLLK